VINVRVRQQDVTNRQRQAADGLDKLLDLVAGVEHHRLAGTRATDDVAVFHERGRCPDFEDHRDMVMCVLDDLIFSVKISTAAKLLGVPIYFERKPDAVTQSARDKLPRLIIFDLNSVKMRPLDAIAALKGDPELRSIRTVGFVSHVDAATIDRARVAGIDEVLARSAFSERLGDLLSHA